MVVVVVNKDGIVMGMRWCSALVPGQPELLFVVDKKCLVCSGCVTRLDWSVEVETPVEVAEVKVIVLEKKMECLC